MKTGIIIPCYNEEKRLDTQAFLNFANFNRDHLLCFVNDGSSDSTDLVLEQLSKQATNICFLNMTENKGKAEAVRAGMTHLYSSSDCKEIGFMDADLSTGFKDFLNLVRVLNDKEELGFVYGSRSTGAGDIKRTFLRNQFSKFVKLFIMMILKLPINDTQCGAKVFKRDLIPVVFSSPFLTSWLFDVEMFIRLKDFFGTTSIMNHIYEQPLDRWVHVDDSRLTIKDSIKIPIMLLNIWVSYNVLDVYSLSSRNPVDNYGLINAASSQQGLNLTDNSSLNAAA